MRPPFLQANDSVGIIAPARRMMLDELEPAITWLQNAGWNAVLGKSIGASENQFAGSDELRRADLQQMLDDNTIRAIWCARGGYGTARLLDGLNLKRFAQKPKWIVGYSDITALHQHIARHTRIDTLHATMPINLSTNTFAASNSLQNTLNGNLQTYQWEAYPLNRQGQVEGKLIGGNLSVLYSLLGSESDIKWQNCILLLEDLDEYLYHIDRMLLNLQRSGKLSNLAGLVVGGMTDMKDNTIPFGKTAYEIIANHTHHAHYPIAFGAPVGHFPDNRAWVLGSKYVLNVGNVHAQMECLDK